ncbi:MAG: tRNA preQ1(34) S-adenosylmethionine ribosyltransferase-isomerase QueA [Sedimentisphaerales bacterium]|nr:tRNA preQ1(34) S-adenosylmethionine ribosyltransferase-isomerase QueA [Sedimentisphaerales bacterium]
MKTEKLNYELPNELIAQQPLPVRTDSRLLVLNRDNGNILDSSFSMLGKFLSPGDCLVLNDTKVLPARFFTQRASGAKLEGLFLEELPGNVWNVYLKGLRKVKSGEKIILCGRETCDSYQAQMLEKSEEGKCTLKVLSSESVHTILDRIGFPPLPPYIKRDDNTETAQADRQRYQTVYAQKAGAVAAPTAGLHFTNTFIEQLYKEGIKFAKVTLHVGAGTFKPITTENLEDHQIHEERFSVDGKNAELINEAKKAGGRIIPVGTTSMRVLETIASSSQIEPVDGLTKLFITPGCKFKICDALITNFHLPKSSLLALAAAFAGLENILNAYNHAVVQRYRFYSYGDAMLIY